MPVVMHVSLWTDYLLSCDLSMIWVDVEQDYFNTLNILQALMVGIYLTSCSIKVVHPYF